MTLEQHLDQAKNLVQWLGGKLDGADIPSDVRSRLAGGCFHSALEYQMAIVLLTEARYHASAFALIRVIYEAYVKGVWLYRCASDADIKKYTRGPAIGKFSDLVAKVESLPGYEARVLSDVSRSWKAMNSFTHTGYMQVVRRQTETTLEANYSEDEVIESLNFASAMGFLSTIALCDLCQNVELANLVLQKAKQDWSRENPFDHA